MTAGITTDLPTQANIQRNNFPLRNSTSLVMSQLKKKKKNLKRSFTFLSTKILAQLCAHKTNQTLRQQVSDRKP